MAKMQLNIGHTDAGAGDFILPLAAQVQTFAYLGIRRSGKTSGATVMAEEFCKQNLPWIALDPVGVWWGLTASQVGVGFQVVVIGGDHGHIPLDRGNPNGKTIADAIMAEPVSVVIDLSRESKTFWRKFLVEFCLRLMEINPQIPRHIFVEEAPEFVPQKAKFELSAQCKEAVERLIRLGGNQGYGMSLISQRPATIDKDVLSQCENLFVLRTVGAHDRKALQEWMESKEVAELQEFPRLADLPSGHGYFYSPQWLNKFTRFQFRHRETFHPGATREVGTQTWRVEEGHVSRVNVDQFVATLQRRLAIKITESRPMLDQLENQHNTKIWHTGEAEIKTLKDRVSVIETELSTAKRTASEATAKLERVKNLLRPQYDGLRALFDEIGETKSNGAVDSSAYEPWLAKAGKAGCRRLLEKLIERPELTRNQLGTLAGVASISSTFRNYLSWLKRNGLIEVDGDKVRLMQV